MRLVAEKDDLAEVRCFFADKYEHGDETGQPLERMATDGIRDYWAGVLSVPTSRLRYFFRITDRAGEVRHLSEHGFWAERPSRRYFAGYFFYPYDLPVDRFTLPPWIVGTTTYLVFPDRFANGDPSTDPRGVQRWGAKPTPRSFFGGDLAGIRQRLDWIRELGIGCLYLTPVFEAPSNHKYDPTDYEKVDPHFGTNADLAALVREAHAGGMRVLLDGVFNHSGQEWFAFRDVREKGVASPYRDWFFKIESFPVDVDAVNYETFANHLRNHPKLNTANAGLREYLAGVGAKWIREADVDGWRLDVANEVDHRFWRAFRDSVKGAKADAFIVGEVWHDAIRWLDGSQWDSVMHYPWRDAVLKYLKGDIGPSTFAGWTTRIRQMYEPAAEPGLLTLLGSHDTARVRTEVGGSVARARQAAVLLLTSPGAPLVYYGDEVGMEGEDDPDCRRCMEWDPAKQEPTLLDTYRTLIALRREKRWLAWGAFEDLVLDDDRSVYAFRRRGHGPLEAQYGAADEQVVVALNTGRARAEVRLPVDATGLVDVLSAAAPRESGGEATIELEPDGAAVLARRRTT